MKSNKAMILTTIVSIETFLEFVAEADVERAHDKKGDDNANED